MEQPVKEKTLTQTVANIVSTVVLVFSVVICVLVIISMKSSSGVANIFGYAVLSVRSDSMEPTFYENDLIIVKMTEPSQRFKKGDVISFQAYDSSGSRFVNTHRIADVIAGETRDRYITKGDNSDHKDSKKLYSTDIIGQYTGKRVSGLGKIVDIINSPTGVLLCVVIPSAIIIIAQALSYASAASRRKKLMLLEAEERARNERIQLVNDVVAAQRGAAGGTFVQMPKLDPSQIDDPEKQRVIEEFLQKQQEEEAKKQAIIEEYLAKQKEKEAQAKEEAEAAKIKAIIAEFLAQQKAGDAPANEPEPSDNGETQG